MANLNPRNLNPREAPTPKRVTCKENSNVQTYDILSERAIGNFKKTLGYDDSLALKIYRAIDAIQPTYYTHDTYWGGIFNLEFSLDGKLVVAACEGKQILLFDAANQKLQTVVENAHHKCVNCVRFLNDRKFATCSDDTLIKLWDVRNVKTALNTLHGHSNWVKNIEWSENEQVMVTSAFDGTIYAWNLNYPTENNMLFDKVFLMNGLMRMKLTPDGSKMVISTTNGYMIIIHNLNLLSLALDLRSFKPSLYRLMQNSDQTFPVATIYNYLFSPTRKRNRIEFIDDFPNEAEVISSLQIHPHGWSAVSRNLNSSENEEWTTVHDIQDREQEDYENSFSFIQNEESDSEESDHEERNNHEELNNHEERNNRRPTDLWMGYISVDDYNNFNRTAQGDRSSFENLHFPSMGIINSGLIGSNASYSTYFQQHPEEEHKIIRNLPRMTHFVKEKNVGKGFIKELCFSSDGRVICSPYDKGIRLLAFDSSCQEMSTCVPERPQQLKSIVEMSDYHRDTVVSCKFSPTHHQITGELCVHHITGIRLLAFDSSCQEMSTCVPEKPQLLKSIVEMSDYHRDTVVSCKFSPTHHQITGELCVHHITGIRLLAFDSSCQEMSTCVPERPQQLKSIVEMSDYHRDTVVSCKFSPTHHQIMGELCVHHMTGIRLLAFDSSCQEMSTCVPEKPQLLKSIVEMSDYHRDTVVSCKFSPTHHQITGELCVHHMTGIRLLAFDSSCQEMSTCVPERPQQLKGIVEMSDYHRDTVVSCKFSPTHHQIVSGCLGSDIKWYQPVL